MITKHTVGIFKLFFLFYLILLYIIYIYIVLLFGPSNIICHYLAKGSCSFFFIWPFEVSKVHLKKLQQIVLDSQLKTL